MLVEEAHQSGYWAAVVAVSADPDGHQFVGGVSGAACRGGVDGTAASDQTAAVRCSEWRGM